MEKLWKANMYQLQSKKLKCTRAVIQEVKSIFPLNSFFPQSNRVCNFKLVLFFCLTSSGLEVRQCSSKWYKFKKFRWTFLSWCSLANKDKIQRNQLPFFCVEWKKNLFSQVASCQLHPFPPAPWIWRWNTFFFKWTFLGTFWCLIWLEEEAPNEEGSSKIQQPDG